MPTTHPRREAAKASAGTEARSYSTGEAAELLGISISYAQQLAASANLDIPRFGKHHNMVWSTAHIEALRPLIKRKQVSA